METKRLDVYLAQNGFCRSRSLAAVLIKNKRVRVNGQTVCKTSYPVSEDDRVCVDAAEETEFVGRGGKKLKKALAVFDISLTGCVCADIGASTGGFCDCMLQNGAARVFAIDVGRGQLAASLLADPRVVNLENTNIRFLPDDLLPPVDFVSCDVSFISLSYVLPVIARLLKNGCGAVVLVKPQFEVGKELVGKNGIVKNPKLHRRVLESVMQQARQNGLAPVGLDYSPIRGGDGNREYLLYLQKSNGVGRECFVVEQVVSDAFREL